MSAAMWILIVALALLLLGSVAIRKGLSALRQQTVNAWSQIDIQLKRRYELIPNLVEAAKSSMKHEHETLESVVQARNLALNAKTLGEKAVAEQHVARSLSGLFAAAEQYPDLKTNQSMLNLQEELRSTENKIAFARQYYNDITTAYNMKIETFPSNIFAGSGGFKPRELFEFDDSPAREAVKV
ncbi:MAG TPA: LemA family protein [Fimbriimonadaceae bacterium]|nr:LemA family protein [Fimbriimonadaceae bacterium]